ncbi:hypothetical protein BLOT_010354 [Blomia tropicalis]|nr:hypothetical protein BLOT_010354 [Blomia tropicalis]
MGSKYSTDKPEVKREVDKLLRKKPYVIFGPKEFNYLKDAKRDLNKFIPNIHYIWEFDINESNGREVRRYLEWLTGDQFWPKMFIYGKYTMPPSVQTILEYVSYYQDSEI